MNIKMFKRLLISSLFAISSFANAGLITLNSGDYYGALGGVGESRGISFEALSTFSISSVGIEAALNAQDFEIVIWSSTNGHQLNNLLASSAQTFGTTSLGWNDIAIDFTFTIGNFYAFEWRPVSVNKTWASTLTYYNDSSLPASIDGKFKLIDGYEAEFGFSNFLHPNLRVNTVTRDVPEPSTLAIFALGIIGLTSRKLKKQ
ncbi:PEP-CTERM sorting domain-containing protein [Thalassotalea castellviae]|uniref:PEP-CTERM sorting domain-containing protein n=1 Tax=Thalassotalea castellviae TaxID=3075612 RepID=A0ABU3A2Q1_9GAMM|nr:PEP-CTERM sorting domain-containing protein [Thalassotalea sp. W431]MDT0604452.1 PEP-CTERM sorting domain-containing protein [Thalassotalea sp. W431]